MVGVTEYQTYMYWTNNRRLAVMWRRTADATWYRRITDIELQAGADGHNYPTFGIDSNGYLHYAGDMHSQALKYYKSGVPISYAWDGSLGQVANMVNDIYENRVTYPIFFNTPDGQLWFAFRDGDSGNGDWVLYVYDAVSGTWAAAPGAANGILIDGKTDDMNPYVIGDPAMIPATNRFAWSFYWRDTTSAATAHDVCYVEYDYVAGKLYKSDGTELTIPLRYADCEIVDSVGINSGFVGSNNVLIDTSGNPLVIYQKVDGSGFVQIYAARLVAGSWVSQQVSSNGVDMDFYNSGYTLFSSAKGILEADDTAHIFIRGLTADGLGLYEFVSADWISWAQYEIGTDLLTQFSTVAMDREYFSSHGTLPLVLVYLNGSGIEYLDYSLN